MTDQLAAIVADPKRSRDLIFSLYRLPDHDWNDWELDWMESQIRRHPNYCLSDKEQNILIKLHRLAEGSWLYQDCSVRKWIELAYRFRADFSEGQAELIEDWFNRRIALRRRQLGQLIAMLEIADVIDAAA